MPNQIDFMSRITYLKKEAIAASSKELLMYGTIARMRPKPGHLDEVLKLSEVWEREHGPNVDGFIASYVFQPDNVQDEFRLVVVFEDRETYEANANRPEQDRWYRQIREHLDADPDWEDGSVIQSITGARPEPTI